ncbi:hypothetical protein P4661_27280 [Priestia megaterium]|uniref:hypothetical protein n=1 Tax=Priestia megaterium TaxID=1404 RepID=UPI002E1B4B85|nr:hypothetical protein [Priestia megaterium]
MADIYKVNASNIVGGAGRLVVKPYDGTFPATIEDVMDVASPYNLKTGWRDIGATTDGISTSRGYDSEEFEVDQLMGAVDEDVTSWSHSLETSLAENTVQNRQLALIGGTIVETPPTLATATTLTAATVVNASTIAVTSATDIKAGGFVQISEGSKVEMKQVSSITGNTVYLAAPLANAYTTAASVRGVTKLGSRRLGFGTVTNIPTFTFALISQKKDGSLYMAVFRKCKVTGDDKEQSFEKGKRTVPLSLTAYPVDGVPTEENVYYELEQLTLTP